MQVEHNIITFAVYLILGGLLWAPFAFLYQSSGLGIVWLEIIVGSVVAGNGARVLIRLFRASVVYNSTGSALVSRDGVDFANSDPEPVSWILKAAALIFPALVVLLFHPEAPMNSLPVAIGINGLLAVLLGVYVALALTLFSREIAFRFLVQE